MKNIQHIIFDLDGTLTNPEQGITNGYAHALAQLGRPAISRAEVAEFIGPSTRDSFAQLLGNADSAEIERAIKLYRAYYDASGWRENKPYPGIAALLQALLEQGYILYVATSKPKVFADRILQHFELLQYFKQVYGVQLTPDEDDKPTLVARLIADHGCAAEACLMIGDRRYDIAAGTANRIKTCAVGYGFGSRAELEGAGADRYCASVAELRAYLLVQDKDVAQTRNG